MEGDAMSFVTRLVALTITIAALSGCSKPSGADNTSRRGYILGDSMGIALIRLETGEREIIRQSDQAHLWWSPKWRPGMSRILCIDRPPSRFSVALIGAGSDDIRVVYSAPSNCDIHNIALTASGTAAFVVESRSVTTKTSLIELALSEPKPRTVAEDNFDGAQIQPLSDKEMILSRRLRADKNSPWVEHVVAVRLDNGLVTELFERTNGAQFAASPDGKSIFVCDQNERFRVFDMSSRKFRELSPKGLRGNHTRAAGICFIGDSDVALFREYDVWSPIGYYRMSIKDGNVALLSTESVEHPVYLETRPLGTERNRKVESRNK
jgi:hypothetical protein